MGLLLSGVGDSMVGIYDASLGRRAFGTSRRLRSRFFQLLASLAFYAVVIYVLVSLM